MLSRRGFCIARLVRITFLIGPPICIVVTYVMKDAVAWPCIIALALASVFLSGSIADFRRLFTSYERYAREQDAEEQGHPRKDE